MRPHWIAWLAAAFCAHAAAGLPAPERLIFPSLDHDRGGAPVMIAALYFRPENVAPDARLPAVVALHGCDGLHGTRAAGGSELSGAMATRARWLLDDGYAVLFPDSFDPRGQRQICTIRSGERTISARTRRLDALGALAFAAALSGVDSERIALVGWSHGGSATLATINADDARVAAFRAAPDAPAFFVAAVAFYPGCAPALAAAGRWQPAAPVQIHIGALDDWTPAQACVELGDAMRARGADLTVTVYPGAHHAFDAPGNRVVLRADVPNGVHPGEGVHFGGQPAARLAATEEVRHFLRERMHNPTFPAYWRPP